MTVESVPTILLKVFGPPLGTALAGLAAEIIRKRLSIGRVQENSKRLHAIRELIEAETLGLSATEKSALQDEAALIAKSLQILRKRAASLKSTADTIQDWSHQPVFRRIFTLPRPRSSNGWIASATCLAFLYWTALTAFTITTELNDLVGEDFLLFLLLVFLTAIIPLALALMARDRATRSAQARTSWSRRQGRQLLFRAFTIPRPRGPSEFRAAIIWALCSLWLIVWVPIILFTLFQVGNTTWLDLSIDSSKQGWILVPGLIIVAILAMATITARDCALDDAKRVVREETIAESDIKSRIPSSKA